MKSFWRNKKVLITGHTGFKGSWLSLILSQIGSEVHGIALKEKKKSFFNTMNIRKILKTNNYCDINDFNKLKKLTQKINPQIIFHLAAQPLVIESYNNPLKTVQTNIVGTANLLKSLLFLKGSKTIIVVTSDKCYDTEKEKSFIETDKLGGNDIYSASKACTEIISSAFRETFFKDKKIKLATVRSGNVIGGGDFSKDRLIPDLIRAYLSNKHCLIRNKESIRPWQHVLDPINGYLKLAEKTHLSKNNLYQSGWNFSPNWKSYKVKDLVKEVKKIIPVKIKYIKSKNKVKETKNLKLNSFKSRKHLKWKEKINFKNSIKFSIEWYINQDKKNKILLITQNQINRILK